MRTPVRIENASRVPLPLVALFLSALTLLGLALVAAGSGRIALASEDGGTPVCGATDIAFVVDTTASMGGAMASISAELEGLLDDIERASGGDYRLSLVTFKDDVTVEQNFADRNRAAIAPEFLAMRPLGGANWPEASDEALNTVIHALPAAGRVQTGNFTPPFREGVVKIIVLITDAEPAGFDDEYTPGIDDVNAHRLAQEAAARGIRISSVYVPTLEGTELEGVGQLSPGSGPLAPAQDPVVIERILRDIATTSGGLFTKTASTGVGTGAALRDLIARCGGEGEPSPSPEPEPEVERRQPANVCVSLRQHADVAIAPGTIFTYTITVSNAGPGDANATSARIPLDAAVEILDFRSPNSEVFVQSLTANAVVVRFPGSGPNTTGTATLIARVRPGAAANTRVNSRATVEWDDNMHRSKVSNLISWTVGTTSGSGWEGMLQSLTVSDSAPVAAGTNLTMTGNFFGGEERVSFWINRPGGGVIEITNYGVTSQQGELSMTLNTTGLAPGTYSLIAAGNCSGTQGRGVFTIR